MDVLVWHPTSDNPKIGSCILTWERDGSVLATYGYRFREDAEELAKKRGWEFRADDKETT